jgi:hypothetical protein
VTATTLALAGDSPRRTWQLGRAFVHPAFDFLVIGGGLSLGALAWIKLAGSPEPTRDVIAVTALLVNSPHFAASTVRLYTKPNSLRDLPFVTMVLPLLMLGLLAAGLTFPVAVGINLVALYFTWSPYHYAAQAYGLAVMYAYRSGVPLSNLDKKLTRAACLLPFLYAFLDARGAAIEWVLPASMLNDPFVLHLRVLLISLLRPACYAVPVLLFIGGALGRGPALPLISVTAMLANAYWWTTLRFLDAFVWATISHGLQYLAIVTIFHVRERKERERVSGKGGTGWWRPAAGFYAVCLAAGYLLFQAWPHASTLAGFSFAQSLLVMVAIINIHHFIVDAFIWRLRRDPNYAVVTQASAAAIVPTR